MRTRKSEVAESVPFDNSTNGFTAEDVQAAIEEINDELQDSASPGYSFGRSGNTPSGTWLLRPGGPPSNKTGITVGFANPELTKITVANENVATFDVTIYEHEGDEVNLTSLSTQSVVSARSAEFSVSVSVTQGRQLAVQISSGSAKNPGVDIQLSGSIT